MSDFVKTFLFIIFLISSSIYSTEEPKTICLNMIVKNESKVIERCLTSMLPIIDYWVIVDTGSTDGTQDVIKNFMKEKGVPGDLYERPWKNFSHNRNEALELAKGKADYVFFIDADEYLEYAPDFKLPEMDKDFYYVTIKYGGTMYPKIQLVNNHKDWKYVGVLHEVICPKASDTYATLEKVHNIYTTEGARSRDPQKYQKDAQVFEEALKEEPNNDRYVFYLAQSYRDAGEYSSAIKNYERRIQMGGWDEELFWSMLQIGILQEALNMPDDIIIKSYNRAHKFRPSRIEPIYHLANFLREKKEDFHSGYQVAKIGLAIPQSHDMLFLQQWMHDYGMLLEFSVAAYWVGKYEESHNACKALLARDLPPHARSCVQNNLGFATEKLQEIANQKLLTLAKNINPSLLTEALAK